MPIITTVLTIILFLFILTAIICIHEFGHFTAAKKFGVTVEEFSIGMGPLVWKKIWHGTQYSIRALPIGGYVKMLGEGDSVDKPGSFSTTALWKRLIIIFAGVVMNFVLVAVIFTALAIKNDGTFFGASIDNNYNYPISISDKKMKIAVGAVQEDSPASEAGLKTGDIINKVDGIDYNGFDEYVKVLDQNENKSIPFEIVAYLSGDTRTVNIVPRNRNDYNLSSKQSRTGISVADLLFIREEYKGALLPFSGILQTINVTHNYGYTIGSLVYQSVEKKNAAIIADNVSSPVAIYAVTKKVLDLNGFWGVMTLTALLSLAIGFMNAIPFPALDGWHGLFIIIEMITKRKMKESIYNTITLIGFVLLLALGILMIVRDVLNFNKFF